MTWLLAGLVAGVLSGAVSWLIALFYKALYVGGLINELTTFAAFTALTCSCPGSSASPSAAGGWTGSSRRCWRLDHGLGVKPERGDGDVFTAARGDESPTGEIAQARREAQTAPTAVATTERDAPTEVIRTQRT